MAETARFSVTLDGHKASVTLSLAGGLFSGIIDSPEYGSGIIRDVVQTGNDLKGTVSLKGYDADFSAKLDGDAITGTVQYGWLFSADFSGQKTA